MALKSLLLTAGFWGNPLWTWNQSLPFRGKPLQLSLLSKVSFMVKNRKKQVKTTGPAAGKAASKKIPVEAMAEAVRRWVLTHPRTRNGFYLKPKQSQGICRCKALALPSALQNQGKWDPADLWLKWPQGVSWLWLWFIFVQCWRYCISYAGAPRVSPFLTDFCLSIFPHPFCNLTKFLKMEQGKASWDFKRDVFKCQWAILNVHFRWSVG